MPPAPALLQIEFESFERARTFHRGAVLALTQIQIPLLKHLWSFVSVVPLAPFCFAVFKSKFDSCFVPVKIFCHTMKI